VPEYRARIDQLLGTALNATSAIQQAVGGSRLKLNLRDKEAVMQLASNVNVAETILHTLGSFARARRPPTSNAVHMGGDGVGAASTAPASSAPPAQT
jgi:hypothetical protein